MAATKNDQLLPVYLINGEDELKRDTVLKRLRARVAALGDLSFNSDSFDGATASGADIVAACNTLPFASELRLVVVKEADKLKKADAEELVSYLAAPASSTVLALVAEKLAKNTRLYKSVEAHGKNAVIDCAPFKRAELPQAVRSMAQGHGIMLSGAAATRLVDLVGENTVRLDEELKKIALAHRDADAVSEHEIIELVSRTSEVKPWEFVDAFSARNLPRCLFCLQAMPSASPYALLAMCVTRLRELICAQTLAARGEDRALATVLKMPDWRVKNHRRWAAGFTAQELRAALSAACDTEQAMKSGTDPDDAFLDWLLAVVGKAAGRTA